MVAVAGELLEKLPLIQVYDELVIPALSLAESDRHEGLLQEERQRFIIDNTRELVIELAEMDAARAGVPVSTAEPPPPVGPIVCLPARDESDEVGGLMLRELLRAAHVHLDLRPVSDSLDQHLAHIRQADARIVVVSSVPPSAVRHAIHVCKRLQTELPDGRVVVGRGALKPTPRGSGRDCPKRSLINCSRGSVRVWTGCGKRPHRLSMHR